VRVPNPDALGKAAANAFDLLVGGGIGDNDKRTPASIIDEGPQRTVYRYLDSERRRRGVPVLLVPPLAAPGRTFGQLYHRFFRVNELAGGRLDLGHRQIDLAEVHVPVLVVAGESDGIAPPGAVFHVADLLPGAPDVRLETAPGGHLGVLTGRSARRTTWIYLDEFLDEVALAPIEEAVSATAA
jgi:pimeloyl-ACP methyl ester carboxylesterase